MPESAKVWEILDKMGQFGLPVKITEFDQVYKGMTEEAQADDLERFYRLCFAHPAVQGIYMWGFYEGAHWRPGSALWRKDWTPKLAAERYQRLMAKDWHSEGKEVLKDGGLGFRGFYGIYEMENEEFVWEVHCLKEGTRVGPAKAKTPPPPPPAAS
ncbi:MAG: hypothetical protein HC904_05390 [Blastochloris sp.]|nr:hypothetical protein [Blastochloris sp.]